MSDESFPDVTYSRPRRVGDTWSVKKIIEQVTGKKLEELQEGSRHSPATSPPTPSLPLFLPSVSLKTGARETIPPKQPERSKRSIAIVRVAGKNQKVSDQELERKYLAYLMLHMETLTEPALKYLREAVEMECRQRGMDVEEIAQ